MFKLFMKLFSKRYKFNDILKDDLVKSCIHFTYTVYNDVYDVIHVELYYHSTNGKYISSVIRTDPSNKNNKKLCIINKCYDNFIDASKAFHLLCEKYHNKVAEGIIGELDEQ